jgi:hypothetical protein
MRSRRTLVVLAMSSLAAGVLTFAGAAPAGATPVSTEAELRAAYATDASVELLNDITLADCTGGGALERTTTDPVVLDGQGFTLTQTCADNAVVQETIGAGLLTVQNITITGGSSSGSGGGIFAQGDLMVINSILRGNHADQFGGAIATVGTLILDNSWIDDNNASQGGGGIAGDEVVTITNSTVSNNLGGGVTTVPTETASLTVINSTISNNSAANLGAGLFSGGSTTLVYATVADNVAQTAFDNIDTNTLTSFGSVVVGTTTGANCLTGPGSVSNGYNYSDDDSCGFDQPTDRQSQPAGSALLGPLADNGGLAATRLPGAGSPLIDAIPVDACQADGASGITTDERGVARPQAGGCDIGAVEVVPVEPIVLQPTFTG